MIYIGAEAWYRYYEENDEFYNFNKNDEYNEFKEKRKEYEETLKKSYIEYIIEDMSESFSDTYELIKFQIADVKLVEKLEEDVYSAEVEIKIKARLKYDNADEIDEKVLAKFIVYKNKIIYLDQFNSYINSNIEENAEIISKKVFNSKFEPFEGETISASTTKVLLALILANNETEHTHQIIVEFRKTNSGIQTSKTNEISRIDAEINNEFEYKIELEFDIEGYVNKVIINEPRIGSLCLCEIPSYETVFETSYVRKAQVITRQEELKTGVYLQVLLTDDGISKLKELKMKEVMLILNGRALGTTVIGDIVYDDTIMIPFALTGDNNEVNSALQDANEEAEMLNAALKHH